MGLDLTLLTPVLRIINYNYLDGNDESGLSREYVHDTVCKFYLCLSQSLSSRGLTGVEPHWLTL